MGRFIRFALVGVAGTLTDAGVLAALLAATPLGPLSARVFSIAIAMLTTWTLNRMFTFGPSGRGVAAEGALYVAVALGVSAFNWLVYAGLLYGFPSLPPVIAVLIAAGLAAALAWFGYSRAVFKHN